MIHEPYVWPKNILSTHAVGAHFTPFDNNRRAKVRLFLEPARTLYLFFFWLSVVCEEAGEILCDNCRARAASLSHKKAPPLWRSLGVYCVGVSFLIPERAQ